MAIPLGSDAVVAGRLERPEDVPSRVSDELLFAVLRHGRPSGQEGEIEVGGARCPTVQKGRGRPVLCVHGLGHDAWDFAPLFDAGLGDVALLALDLPGFGLADKPAYDVTLALLVEAVLGAAERCARPPVVVASSLGGHVALLAAEREPDAFDALFLVAPGGLEAASDSATALARAYYSFDAICARADDDVVRNSRRIFVGPHPAREALAARKLALHRSSHKSSFARAFASIVDDVFRHPLADRIAEIRVPMRLVFGDGDIIVPAAVGLRVAERHGLELTVLEGVGHLPMVEAPDAFAHALAGFLDERKGGA